ncbi:dTDP-4-dehydrorhamnose 3,5-epimerase [Flavipsychrobacter stenotrophus]|uniref:dTDP-4-dehydrorhamnose 3,5-epimerase n=1 Tax=Flavipsychrobacter stenotrophus TaxID=2077091 RepID=A0A2S7SQZ3_9BACT|nr:dTDP-4-dehydrorhamnose 3,5-epimerase [Flavipsychrobacter stenotrophus]PQJ09322.1 dTDP-4-dehydrorhamnose 3,5-epimerase [Flavipsychrobacter stenotrophus]
MKVTKTHIDGLLILEPKVHGDERGYFFESYRKSTFEDEGNAVNFIQDNQARSIKNVLRGLHYQNNPVPQCKLLRVLEGSIWDVAVDIRKGSKTYGQWYGIELSAENKVQFLIPHGFAHGYAVLSDTAEVFYKCDNYYSKDCEGGLYYADPAINIDWKIDISKAIVSEKDQKQPLLKDANNLF